MSNDIKLGNSKPVDKHLRPLKVDGEPTSLETSSIGNGSRVTGDLEVLGDLNMGSNGKINSNANILILNAANVTFRTSAMNTETIQNTYKYGGNTIGMLVLSTANTFHLSSNTDYKLLLSSLGTGDIEIDSHNYIILDAEEELIYIKKAGTNFGYLHTSTADTLTLLSETNYHLSLQSAGTGNVLIDSSNDIEINAEGGTITMKDGSASHFLFDCDATRLRIYDDTDAADFFDIQVAANGETTIATVDDGAAVGHLNIEADGHVEFDNCAVGFDSIGAVFAASDVIGGGNPDTDIDFRLGNKFHLELLLNIPDGNFLNLIFPATSGNFLLVLGQDGTGSRTVHANSWKAYASDVSACANQMFVNGTDGVIRWAGGSAPTLTTTADKADIISFYWEADSQTAFAVVTQNF